MPVTRHFLGWDRPALPEATEFLFREFSMLGRADFTDVVVVLPGRRAGRRLLELLVDRAEDGSGFRPPAIVTIGNLPERLYVSQRPFASQAVQLLAWKSALQQVDSQCVSVVSPNLPDGDDLLAWLELSELFWRQHRELAADGLDFSGVVQRGAELDGFSEERRWRAMRQIQEKYLEILDEHRLWDRQMARLHAIEHAECHTEQTIVLLGTVDMNRATRQMLAQVADRVTALVHAPQDVSERFDEFGCLRVEAWQRMPVEVPRHCVRVVDGPDAQADEVLQVLAERQGQFRADEISIGMADESLMPHIQRSLARGQIVSRWGVGRSLVETEPVRLLSAIGQYLADPRSSEFAALVRHPAVDNWLLSQGVADDMISELDRYLARRLQPELGEWLGGEHRFRHVRRAHELVQELLEPLRDVRRTLAAWVESLQHILQRIYASQTFSEQDAIEHTTLSACRAVQDALVDQQEIPDSMSPSVTAGQAIAFCLNQLGGEVIPPLADRRAIELLGWLELPLDDAPLVVVTSFNEGHIPGSMNAHLFLPDRLRTHLGLLDNQRRLARDAYNLTLILESRGEVCFIAGRRSESGDPLTPSRLMLSTSPAEAAARLVAFYDGADSVAALHTPESVTSDVASEFVVPAPARLDQVPSTLHVTSFRTYLTCRYRFYLGQILRLETVCDDGNELDALGFGNLLHAVLDDFGESPVNASDSTDDVRRYLREALETISRRDYGDRRLPAVDVQIAQLWQRLDAFAVWQVERVRAGWRIHSTEKRLETEPDFLNIDGQQFSLVGRIDRIDRHVETGAWQVLDYKSGNSVKTPRAAHFTAKRGWLDLQLPLYRHLAMTVGCDPFPELGYVAIPKDTDKMGLLLGDWTPQELAAADNTARDVAQRILEQAFWKPENINARMSSEFAPICQDGVLQRQLANVPEAAS